MKRNEVLLGITILLCILLGLFTVYRPECFDDASPALSCTPGYWCPTASGGAKAYPCPGGTYGSAPKLTDPKCSGFCDPGCVCNEASTTSCPTECPPGYYCVVGTGGVTPPIICPQGYYCPKKTSVPIVCPPGIFCAPGTASI